jgi:hypothetical protein
LRCPHQHPRGARRADRGALRRELVGHELRPQFGESEVEHLRVPAGGDHHVIGEKLLNYIRASDSDPSWAAKLPLFAAEINRIFTTQELRTYFATTTRVGAAAHVATEEQYQTLRDAGAFGDSAVTGAADAVLFERARELLLGGAAPGERL